MATLEERIEKLESYIPFVKNHMELTVMTLESLKGLYDSLAERLVNMDKKIKEIKNDLRKSK